MTYQDQPSFFASDGKIYSGNPPPGWVQDGQGRWWPPPSGPVHVYPTEQPRRWFHKKRYIVPLGVLGGLMLAGAIADGPADETTSIEELATEVPATGVPAESAADPDPGADEQAAPVEEAPPATTVAEEPADEVTGAEVEEWANIMAFRFTAAEAVPSVSLLTDEEVVELGAATCELARDSESADQLSLLLLVVWEGADENTQAALGNNPENMALVAGAAVGAFCPEELDRLGLS